MSARNSDDTQELKEILANPLSKKYKINFIFNGKPSSAIFTINKRTNGLTIENQCIKINYLRRGVKYEFSSMLKKNDEVKRCFEPALNVRRPGNTGEKHTMTDALQILASKISLSMPDYVKGSIEIADSATIDDISITPFRLLRGQDGLYEKYGYGSSALTEFKRGLKELKWGDLMSVEDIREILTYFAGFRALRDVLANVGSDELVVDVFRHISFEDEKATADNKYDASLSSNVYLKIKEHFFDFGNEDPAILYLDEDSKKWAKMSKAVLITSVEEVRETNKRNNKTRKNRRRTIG
jgi:hypothetical protein